MWDFQGRKAVVTGGARGIGLAITRALQEAGAEVHIFDIEESEASEASSTFYRVDVASADQVEEAAAALPDDIAFLINNAGITRDRSLPKMNDDEWQAVIDTNLSGAFHMIRALAPRMREAGYGRIVNITSINGLRGKFGQANYAAAKAGLIGLTKTAARELGPKGITVNAVAPGMVMTEMARQLPQQFVDKALAECALTQLAEPEDIAHTVLFLLSDYARMITGEVIKVDGGQYI